MNNTNLVFTLGKLGDVQEEERQAILVEDNSDSDYDGIDDDEHKHDASHAPASERKYQ